MNLFKRQGCEWILREVNKKPSSGLREIEALNRACNIALSVASALIIIVASAAAASHFILRTNDAYALEAEAGSVIGETARTAAYPDAGGDYVRPGDIEFRISFANAEGSCAQSSSSSDLPGVGASQLGYEGREAASIAIDAAGMAGNHPGGDSYRPPMYFEPIAVPNPAPEVSESFLSWPACGTLTSLFGRRAATIGSTNHQGIDICGPYGQPIYAADGGEVIVSQWSDSYGYYIRILHDNGYITSYCHCRGLLVSVGEKVSRGQQIAGMGNTGRADGVHLHFELIIDGVCVDPLPFLQN